MTSRLLARHFVKAFAAKADKDIQSIEPEALAVLEKYDWPGNIRELKNAIERAMVVAEPPTLRAQDLATLRIGHRETKEPHGETLADVERAHVLRMLDKADWNISQAARMLEVDRVTLYNKIKKYGLRR